MTPNLFKVHTDTFGRLTACIQKAMYGISTEAVKQMPTPLCTAKPGDMVFISEREVSGNALFGPFYIVAERAPVAFTERRGAWGRVDIIKTPRQEMAYWVEFEKRCWCLLFDKTLSDRISIVWPYDWRKLRLNLPSWGVVTGEDTVKLTEFAARNEISAREFFHKHGV